MHIAQNKTKFGIKERFCFMEKSDLSSQNMYYNPHMNIEDCPIKKTG